MEDYTSLELMTMTLPHTEDSSSIVCAECGKKILQCEVSFRVEDERIHQKCYKPDNIIPMIPIGCENINEWRNPGQP